MSNAAPEGFFNSLLNPHYDVAFIPVDYRARRAFKIVLTPMSNRTFTLSETLYEYLISASLRESNVLQRLRKETASHPMARMQIAPEQGQFMALLVNLIGAKRCIEVGTFTGYSALAVALALPEDGRLIACDVSEEFTAIGRRYWQEAGVAHKIELVIAPALQTLDRLIGEGKSASFDFVFIDADKTNYWNYFERALQLLRTGGLIAVDNTLWDGRVADPDNREPDTVAIRDFNARVKDDQRVRLSLVPIGDGLTLAQKR